MGQMAGEDDPTTSAYDVIATAGAEAVLVEVAGHVHPVLGVLAAAATAGHQALNAREWQRRAAARLTQLGVALNPEDPMTAALISRLSTAAAQTADGEKLDLLVNALVNGTHYPVNNDYVIEHFASLISRFSALHVRVLRTIADRRDLDLKELDEAALLRALQAPDSETDLRMIIGSTWDDLVAEGLILGDSTSSFHNHDVDELGGVEFHNITPKGRRFLRYLSHHPNKSSASDTQVVESEPRD